MCETSRIQRKKRIKNCICVDQSFIWEGLPCVWLSVSPINLYEICIESTGNISTTNTSTVKKWKDLIKSCWDRLMYITSRWFNEERLDTQVTKEILSKKSRRTKRESNQKWRQKLLSSWLWSRSFSMYVSFCPGLMKFLKNHKKTHTYSSSR